MANILVIFGTSQGQSAKIAGVIAEELRSVGHHVDLRNSRKSPGADEVLFYDAVIAGASVHASGYQRAFRKWAKRNSPALAMKPTAFFSVCLGILQKDPGVQVAEQKIVDDFFRESHWRPERWKIFAGALPYSKYNFLLKRIMQRIARKAGGDTDIRKDYEYTDWPDVRQFARDFGSGLSLRH